MNKNNKGKSISGVTTATMTKTNSSTYRTAIPAAIREVMGIEKGDKILWIYNIKDDSLTIEIKND